MMTDPLRPTSRFHGLPDTPWSLIRSAWRAEGDQQRELLGRLAQHYWRPLYAYFRAKGQPRPQAEDLVQEFVMTRLAIPDALPP